MGVCLCQSYKKGSLNNTITVTMKAYTVQITVKVLEHFNGHLCQYNC